jgi:phenylacetate-coenzyme A ligase PaaK-like adenylate-forming protein
MLVVPESDAPIVVPPSVRSFCEQRDPYRASGDADALFVAAMGELTRWHASRLLWYRALLEEADCHPEQWRTMQDVVDTLPMIHANFFKAHEVRSIGPDQVALHLTSSGTTGQKSQIFFDAFTIDTARRMVDDVFRARGLASETPSNYLVNAYEPHSGMRLGTSNTNLYLLKYAPVREQFWTLRSIDGTRHEFDPFGAVAALQRFAQSGAPLRVVGFPAFLHFVLERMVAMGVGPFRFAEGSWVMLGGGWKGHADKEISRDSFREEIDRLLGIPPRNVIESFGSVEHSIPYVSCEFGHLHAPVWSRVVIRDTGTLQPVPDDVPGFLGFLSPYILSAPAHNVVMGDYAVRHAPSRCPCGRSTAWFEILGRAGVSKNRSCAVAAAELLADRSVRVG